MRNLKHSTDAYMSINSGIKIIMLIIIIFIAILLVYWAYHGFFVPKSPIEISNFSIKPSFIKEGKRASITVGVRNLDMKTHEIKLIFKVSPRVLIFKGAEQPLPKENSFYTYTFTLDAADPEEERIFTVTATLEEGISRADYPLSLSVLVDGKELRKTWKDLSLTVQR